MTDSIIVNEATGEVTATIGSETFRLHATFERIGELQARLGERGLVGLNDRLRVDDEHDMDVVAYRHAFETLCVSGNAEKLNAVAGVRVLPHVVNAVMAAFNAFLPESGPADRGQGEGNREAPAAKT